MSDKIRVLLVKPMKEPEIVEIPHTLAAMQKTVGGDIEAVYPFDAPVALVCNDEGKINGLPLNRSLRYDDGEIYDVIAGDFFICDVSGEDFQSLSDAQIKEYTERFRYPERFLRTPDGVKAITVIPAARNNNDAR